MKARKHFRPAVYAAIIAKQDRKCGCKCGEALGTDPRLIAWDHIRPLWDGGKDEPDNLQALLVGHHARKTAGEAGRRAKLVRIVDRDGMRLRKPNARDKALAKMLNRKGQ